MGSSKEKSDRDVNTLRPAVLLLLVAIELATACSSSEVATNASNAAGSGVNNASVSKTANINVGDPNTNIPVNTNIETASNRFESKREQMRNAANSVAPKPLPVNSRPAPEDSTISTQLTDVARETRVWQKHPALAKVEKIYDGKGSTIKVYLKDGRVIDLSGTAIPQLEQVSSATVLTLAGITAADARPNETKTGRAPKKTYK